MGRPGRKQGKTGDSQTNADQQDERLVDLLDKILQCAEFAGSDNEKKRIWDTLSSLLRIFAMQLERAGGESLPSPAVENDGDHNLLQDPMLQTEITVQDVRIQADLLLSSSQDLSTELGLCHELDALFASSKTLVRLRPLAGSFMVSFKRRRQIVREAIETIYRCISHLYSVELYDDIIKTLHETSNLIRHRCIDLRESPFNDAMQLIEQLSLDNVDSNAEVPSPFSKPLDETSNDQSDRKVTIPAELGKALPSPIYDAIEAFVVGDDAASVPPTSMLLVGPEGSGKSYCCNKISQILHTHVKVIRPSLPFDILGLTVGSAENHLISMVNYAKSTNEKCILILDDIENIVGVDYEGPSTSIASENNGSRSMNGEPHLIARLRCLLFSLLDALMQTQAESRNNSILLLCTAKTNVEEFTDRFDVTCNLGLPSPQQRRQVILEPFATFSPYDERVVISSDPAIEAMLQNLVECTSGCSFAELSQYCRQSISASMEDDSPTNWMEDGSTQLRSFCKSLKQQLQSSMPESLRTGLNADFVDMTVLTARDLIGQSTELPLLGNSAQKAWQDLRRSIVVPVCQAKALNKLLFDSGKSLGGGDLLTGGVLLTGPPGTGKTTLAYHCAAVASSINPSVKLIDVSCTSLIHKEVGSSERSIHRLFKIAKAAAPCIVLMDGIENVAAVRGNDNTTEGTMDRVLSTLLTALDGVDAAPTSTEEPATMAIVGVTHNVNWIDPALRRPGRLDRILELGPPELDARQSILLNHLVEAEFEPSETEFPNLQSVVSHVAEHTEGLTGAELGAICDNAKMLASKEWFDGTQTSAPALAPEHILAAMKLRSY